MAQEQILFPNKPVFLVDRGWLKPSSRSRKAGIENSTTQFLYEIPMKIQSPVSSPLKKATRSKDKKPNTPPRRQKQKKKPSMRSDRVIEKTENGDGCESVDQQSSSGQELNQSPSKPFSLAISKPCDWDAVSGFESYLHYYSDTMPCTVYPIESQIDAGPNPLRVFWIPLALTDSLLLKTSLAISVIHRSVQHNIPRPETFKRLMSSVLNELNHRIWTQEFSEATIGAVSCLAMTENWLGNFPTAKTHIKGMAEMVRLRGCLPSISGDRRMKIWKADVVYSMDLLCLPTLPRPPRSPDLVRSPQPVWRNLPQSSLDVFINSRTSAGIVKLFSDLSNIVSDVEYAWLYQAKLDSDQFYEDVTCLQHDLLTLDTYTEADEMVRLGFIIFVKPFNRPCCYTAEASRTVSKRMQKHLQETHIDQLDPKLVLWLCYVGGMVSRNTLERAWFNQRLLDFREDHQIGSWSEMKTQLQEILWTSPLHDRFGEALWDDLNYEGIPHSLSTV